MGKPISQKNTEQLILQQRQELDQFKADGLTKESLRAAEDRLLQQCMETVEGLLDFSALDFTEKGELDENQLPEAWSKLSLDEKAKKIRLARYGCLPSSDIPHGAKLAHATLIGIIKARATENSGTKIFNMEVSTFPAPAPLKKADDIPDADFEVIDLE